MISFLGAFCQLLGKAIGALISFAGALVTGLIVYLGQAHNAIIQMLFTKLNIANLGYWTYVFAIWIVAIILESIFGGVFNHNTTVKKDDD